jgi:UDP-N-acetylglucosamine:LPS N-acetylglucosamine transferase
MSQYAGRGANPSSPSATNTVTILLGYDNYEVSVLKKITNDHNTQFTIVGNKREYALAENCTLLGPVNDVSKAIAGEVVISAAGQNTISELLSLNKRLILLPEPRPYDEQAVHADALAKRHVALLADASFGPEQWQNILQKANLLTPSYEGLVNASAPEAIAQKMGNWYA